MHGYYTRQMYGKVKTILTKLTQINRRLLVIGGIAVVATMVVAALGLRLMGQPAKAKTIGIDKSFRLPAISRGEKRTDGVDLFYEGEVEIKVREVEVTREVLVKNQPVAAKSGRVYLVFKLDIKNDSTQKLGFMANDVVRLQVGESKRAPDLHNNLIEIAPVSTREDRVGFIVDSKLRSVKLQFGKFYETTEVLQEIPVNW